MQTAYENWDSLIPKIENLAHEKSHDKILSRVPEEAIDVFRSHGYQIEAEIPGLYNSQATGYFLANYLNKERSHCGKQKLRTIASVKSIAQAANSNPEDSYFDLTSNLNIRKLDRNDLFAMVNLHDKAFKSYPFPIHKAEYLLELIEQDHEFYGLFEQEQLLVSAILKKYRKESSIEIVDFATPPDYIGQNLSYYLVQEIKAEIEEREFKTVYCLVRVTSYGLNITFSKHGFSFGGTLLTNNKILKK